MQTGEWNGGLGEAAVYAGSEGRSVRRVQGEGIGRIVNKKM